LDLEERWEDVFSEAQRKLLNIARALVFNAEIICFHNPLAKLDMELGPLVMQVIREHIQAKGLALDGDAAHRRPRTIFLTSSHPTAIMKADLVYNVSPSNGISITTRHMACGLPDVGINEQLDLGCDSSKPDLGNIVFDPEPSGDTPIISSEQFIEVAAPVAAVAVYEEPFNMKGSSSLRDQRKERTNLMRGEQCVKEGAIRSKVESKFFSVQRFFSQAPRRAS